MWGFTTHFEETGSGMLYRCRRRCRWWTMGTMGAGRPSQEMGAPAVTGQWQGLKKGGGGGGCHLGQTKLWSKKTGLSNSYFCFSFHINWLHFVLRRWFSFTQLQWQGLKKGGGEFVTWDKQNYGLKKTRSK